MADTNDAVIEAIVGLMPPLLQALDTLAVIARRLHPPELAALMQELGSADAAIEAPMQAFRAAAFPEALQPFCAQLEQVRDQVTRAFDGLRAAAAAEDGIVPAYRALRHLPRALEALYPVAEVLPPVSRFFLEPAFRQDTGLQVRLAQAERSRGDDIGVMHASNDNGMRGGFSLYVPEYYDPSSRWPLIVALHGGSGHGRGFLWNWLREARSRGAILLSPTAMGGTWSLMEPALDSENLERMVDYLRERWNIDTAHMLLTGMSDGGTFSLVSGLREASPFTHLAPIAASFHPFMLELTSRERIAGLPIRLIHGVRDWMFPVAMARTAREAFTAAGAAVSYREVPDLSHTYPREENAGILDWFLGPRPR